MTEQRTHSVGSVLIFLAVAVLAAGAIAGVRVLTGAPRAWASTSTSTAPAPFVTLDTFSGPPGATVNVSGGNFTPGETVDVAFGSISGMTVATTTARGDSLFGPVAVTVPASSTQGPLAIVATGASSSLSAYNSYYVVPLTPAIVATSTSDAPGTVMYVSGTGFMAGETVDIALAGATTTAVANGSGAFFSAALTIPAVGATGGSETVTATGASSGAAAVTSFYVGGYYPTVTASSYFTVPGSTISFSGSGWEPHEQVREYEDGGVSLTTSIATDGTGSFADEGAILIPAGTATSTTFTFIGASSTASTSVTVGIGALYPTVTPSAYYALPGETLTFTGTGFADGEPVAMTASTSFAGYSSTTLATFTADASGTFTNAGSFTVPDAWTGGAASLMFRGASSSAQTSAAITVGTYRPYLTLSQYFLQRGNSFSVSGAGFGADEPVAVSAYGNGTAPVMTDASGAFSNAGPFIVPLSSSSTLAISATGARSGATASTTLSVGDTVARQLSSSTLTVSLLVNNGAGGLATSSDFTVMVNGANATPASFTGNASGTAVTVLGDTDFSVGAAPGASSTTDTADYVLSSGTGCTGQIASGMQGACALTETYVVPPPPIAIAPTSSLPDGTVGAAYSAVISASTTAPGTFLWRVASGTLPLGLSLDASSTASTTSLSGTPSTAGTYDFVIGATNGSSTAQQAYTLVIAPAPSPSLGSGGSGSGSVVYVNAPSGGGGGGGGGGTGYYSPSPSSVNPSAPSSNNPAVATTTATTADQGGLVLGASTVNIAALRDDLAVLEQRLIGLELEAAAIPMSARAGFTRNLSRGMVGTDVLALQKFLNACPLTEVAKTGPGSPGHETDYFGPATAAAVIRFQEIFADKVLAPIGLTTASGFVGPSTRMQIDSLLMASSTAQA